MISLYKPRNQRNVLGVLFLLAALTMFASCGEKPSKAEESGEHHEEEEETARGPHGGRLLSKEDFQLEITIYELGVPPQFRVYAYENEKPVEPSELQLNIELNRLGGKVDRFQFQKEGDYLRGNGTVEEPHSFDVKVSAQRKGKNYYWEYPQIEGRAELSPEQIQSAGIVVETAGPAQIKTTLELPGEISLNQDKVAHVVPRLAGVVSSVRKNLGDPIRKGEVIAVIESRELAGLKSEYLSSVKKRELARTTFEREENLFKKKISSEQDYLSSKQSLEEAQITMEAAAQRLYALGLSKADLKGLSQNSHTGLTGYAVRAPFDGVIIEKDISLGEAIKEDADIFIVADLSTVWVEVTIYAKDLNLVQLGLKVTVRSKPLGFEQQGTLTYLGSLVGEQTRAAKGLVVLANSDRKWRPGLFVSVELLQKEVAVPVAVSAESIQTYRDWSVVFAQFGNLFEVRPLELGRRDDHWVEVIEGLSAGEKYASKNSFVLKAELGKSGASHEH